MTSTSWRSSQKKYKKKKTPEATKHVQNEPTSDNTIGHHYVHRKANIPLRNKGKQHPHRTLTYKWLNQNKIGRKYWNIWETCVKDTFCHNKTKLRSPLTDWIEGAELSQQWLIFADHDTGNLIWITGEEASRQCREQKWCQQKNTFYTTKAKANSFNNHQHCTKYLSCHNPHAHGCSKSQGVDQS